jgi:hypothetical protein
MKIQRTLATVGAFGLFWALIAVPADAGGGSGKGGGKVKGHVVKVEQQVRTQNDGGSTRLTIRTRKGDEMQLHLGNSENCQGCVQVGDRIQARLQSKQGPNGGHQVQSMKVRRDGQMFSLQNNGAGSMVRRQAGPGNGSGAGQKNQIGTRTRLRDGSNCNDSGQRSGQGGVNAGGGSRGPGGGSRGGGGGGGGGRG